MSNKNKKDVDISDSSVVRMSVDGGPAKAALPDLQHQMAELRRRALIMELKGLNKILGYSNRDLMQ